MDRRADRVELIGPDFRLDVSIELDVLIDDEWSYWITYRGTDADLIASGVATVELLAKGRPGHTRRTAVGARCFLKRWKNGRAALEIHTTAETAEHMPGVRRWVAAWVADLRAVCRA